MTEETTADAGPFSEAISAIGTIVLTILGLAHVDADSSTN
jgi:hypothetical protein